jgi:epoxyqueuosine reductase
VDRRELTRRVREATWEQGFSAVGIAAASALPRAELATWLERSYHGEMDYMARGAEKRLDPSLVVEDIRSIVSVALDYHSDWEPPYDDPRRGVISRYALGRDYHRVLERRLGKLIESLRRIEPAIRGRAYVDTGPVMEKVWAARAGLGWIGKHTNLISRERGSWFFLGELLLTEALEPDLPVADYCGSCTRCIEVCPTEAIVEPYVLDATRCISYLTIELRGSIPEEFRRPMGNLVFGCDLCQDVCPWNRKATGAGPDDFREPGRDYSLRELSRLTPAEFSRTFTASPVKRARWRGFMRNVAVAMGNSGSREYVPDLRRLLRAGDPVVAEHAAWALERIAGRRGEASDSSDHSTSP